MKGAQMERRKTTAQKIHYGPGLSRQSSRPIGKKGHTCETHQAGYLGENTHKVRKQSTSRNSSILKNYHTRGQRSHNTPLLWILCPLGLVFQQHPCSGYTHWAPGSPSAASSTTSWRTNWREYLTVQLCLEVDHWVLDCGCGLSTVGWTEGFEI